MKAPDHIAAGRALPLAGVELLVSAVAELEAATAEPDAALRYVRAHLVARRAAAAVLAARARSDRRSSRPRNVWEVLPGVAPELTEWAQFFAAGTGRRIAAEAGVAGAVSAREADDMLRDAHNFLDRVVVSLSRRIRSAG
jgi:hypothetical protein